MDYEEIKKQTDFIGTPTIYDEYKKTGVTEMRPVTDEDILKYKKYGVLITPSQTQVSISEADLKKESPKIGDMIARGHDIADQWLVEEKYFEDTYGIVEKEIDKIGSITYLRIKELALLVCGVLLTLLWLLIAIPLLIPIKLVEGAFGAIADEMKDIAKQVASFSESLYKRREATELYRRKKQIKILRDQIAHCKETQRDKAAQLQNESIKQSVSG